MSAAEVFFVLLPEIAMLEIIKLMVVFHWIILPWNLAWFLVYQMVSMMLNKQAVIASLHWGVHLLSHTFQISERTLKVIGKLIMDANQFHNFVAKEQGRNKKQEVSTQVWKLQHIDAMLLPLSISLSSVGNLSCMSLQAIMDLEGGMSRF